MTLKDHEKMMLRGIVSGRNTEARQFTHGERSISPSVIAHYLQRMAAAGLVTYDGQHVAPTQAGRDLQAQFDAMVPSRTLGNGTAEGTYRPTWAPLRPGADDHKAYKSLTPFVR